MKNISRYDTKKFIFNYFKFQLPLSLYIIACEIITAADETYVYIVNFEFTS